MSDRVRQGGLEVCGMCGVDQPVARGDDERDRKTACGQPGQVGGDVDATDQLDLRACAGR
ncbi:MULTISPECIES: hypothetical protein [unclassified Blastococcus]